MPSCRTCSAPRRALSAHDRATLQDAAFGTLRFLGEIDTVLDDLLKRPLESDRLRNLLRIALYQLIRTRAAPHAVVDHAVRSASALGEARAKGLVERRIAGVFARSEAACSTPRTAQSSVASRILRGG